MIRKTEDYDDNPFTKLIKSCSDTEQRAETMYVLLESRAKDIQAVVDYVNKMEISNKKLSNFMHRLPIKAENSSVNMNMRELVLDEFQKELLSRLEQYGVTIYSTEHNKYIKGNFTGHPMIHNATMAHLTGEENRGEYIKQCVYTINSFFEVYTGEPLFPNISPQKIQEQTKQGEEENLISEERFNLMMAMHFAQKAFRGKE